MNELKVDDDGITTMDKFVGTTKDINIKNDHTWGCPVYALDAIFQGNLYGLPKWEPHSLAWIYLGN